MQNSTPPTNPFYKTWVFWVVCLYLLIIFLYTLKFCLGKGENVLLPSNELGDFLAGAFAPLAFLFLILGYKQNSESIRIQNEELKASTEALKLQVAEMKESVDQQKIMAQLQQRELEDRHNSVAPVINFQGFANVMAHKIEFRLIFINLSEHPARNIIIEYLPGITQEFAVFPKDHRQELESYLTPVEDALYRENKDFEREIRIQYENIFGHKYEQIYKVHSINVDGKRYSKTEKIS
ncbi:hypothetical protein [Acinetobacter baumannii]|uniref:hypothetical protein n=1 Tax=Acinetobacter baumannii TaxID=470 RepID=UPI0034D957F9